MQEQGFVIMEEGEVNVRNPPEIRAAVVACGAMPLVGQIIRSPTLRRRI